MEKPDADVITNPHEKMIEPHKSSFEDSDQEQARIRLILPAAALLWSTFNPLNSYAAISLFEIELHCLIAVLYLLVGIGVFCLWRAVYRWGPHYAPLLRGSCLVGDITAISTYSAVSENAAVILLPIYLSAIIGYGMRFGRKHLLAALGLSLVELLLVIHFNSFLSSNTPVAITYFISIIFVPIYTLVLLQKYALVLSAYKMASREREEFIDVMSHEFRAPLHSIISLVESCQMQIRRASIDSPVLMILNTSMSDALKCAERMLSIANRITAQRRTDRAQRDVSEPRRTSFNTFRDIFLSIRVCAIHARRKKLRLHWTIADQTPSLTSIESSTLQEILINLLDNAVKNTETGEVALHVSFERTTPCRGNLKVEILDTGPGMHSTNGELDANNYHGVSLVTRENAGLGLAITKRSIASLSGTLLYGSQNPSGTRLVVNLPVTTETSSHSPENEFGWARVLIVAQRALSEAEENALIEARLFPQFVYGISGFHQQQSIGQVQYVVCLEDQIHTFRSLQSESIWPLLSALPLVLLYESESASESREVFSPNFCVATADHEQCSSGMLAVRMFMHSESGLVEDHESVCRLSGSVLLLDDSELTIEATQRILEGSGYSCTIALTIEHALSALQQSRIDVIVADRFIGQLDFIDFLGPDGIVGRSGAQTILLTGDSEAADAINASGVTVARILMKPVSSARLRGAVASLIASQYNTFAEQHAVEASSQMIDWALLEEIIGSNSTKEGSRRILLRFEDELLSDCVKSLRHSRCGDSLQLAALLHRMSGVAMLFGAVGLASKLTEYRLSVVALAPADPLGKEIEDLVQLVLGFSTACRMHFSLHALPTTGL